MTAMFVTLTNRNGWGRGETAAEAVRKAKEFSSSRPSAWATYAMPEGATDPAVDQFGRMTWTWAEDAPDRTAQPTVVADHSKGVAR